MTDTTDPQTGRTSAIYDAIDAFQRTHRLPGLQHAQIRGLLAEHLARTLPAAVSPPPATGRAACPRCRHDERTRGVLQLSTLELYPPDHVDDCPAGLRDRIAGLFRHPPGAERLGDATPGEIADAVLSVLPPAADRAAAERLSRVLEWVTGEVVSAKTEFGDGYRAAQRDIRDLVKGRFDYDPRPATPPAVVAEPGKGPS